MRVGAGAHTYELVEGWAKLPDNWTLGWIGSIGTDSQGRVFCFNRGTHPMTVFDRDGNVIGHWGDDVLSIGHGVFMDQHEHLWLTDVYSQVVWVYNTEGELQRRIGRPHRTRGWLPGYPAGVNDASKEADVGGGLFTDPTNTWVTPDGTIFVADGYGDTVCHRLSPDGQVEKTWGSAKPGTGPGEFALPHGICVLPDDRVLVADRENGRVQVFDRDGVYLDEWTDGLVLPADFYVDTDASAIYVADCGGAVTVLDFDGAIIASWGEAHRDQRGLGMFAVSPHGIWKDDQGALYVCEVGANDLLHKFVPVG